MFLSVGFLLLGIVALNSASTNIDLKKEQIPTTWVPSTDSIILKVLSSNKTILTNNTYNSTYEMTTAQERTVTHIQPKVYSTSTTYTETKSDDSLSPGAIAGIVIGILFLICCCGGCGYKNKEIWELRRVA